MRRRAAVAIFRFVLFFLVFITCRLHVVDGIQLAEASSSNDVKRNEKRRNGHAKPSNSIRKTADQAEQKARRRAIIFARSKKSDEETEALVEGFDSSEHGAIFYELGRVFTVSC